MGIVLLRRTPIQDLQLNTAAAVVFVNLGCKGQVERGGGYSLIGGVPPNSFERSSSVVNPQFEVLFLSTDVERGAMQVEFAGEQLNGRIILACGAQLGERRKAFQMQIYQAHFGVEAQRRLEFLGLESIQGKLVEAGAKSLEVGR